MKRDGWNNPSNWKGGKVAAGDMAATVAKGVHVTVNSDSTPSYKGALTLMEGAKIRLAWSSASQNIRRAVTGASKIIMKTGSEIVSNMKGNVDFPPIMLEGDAGVSLPSTGSHWKTYSFQNIDSVKESAKFSLISCHGCTFNFNKRSTMASFAVTVIGKGTLRANAPGCFGPGDVSLSLGPTHGQELKLSLQESNAIATSARLSLTSKSSRFGQGKIEISLADGVSQVVAGLVVDGKSATKGVYREGVRNVGSTQVTFVGKGELVVKR